MGMRVHFLSIFSILSILLAGCGVDAASAVLSSNPEACLLPISTPNPYSIVPDLSVFEPYTRLTISGPMTTENQYWQARYDAFQLLRTKAERWSSNIDIDLSKTKKVRITITYFSPQLFQLIELNQILTDATIQDIKNNQIKNNAHINLVKAADLQGTIFLVTVHAVNTHDQSPVAVYLPVKNMVLIDAAGKTIHPIYHDYGFDETLYLTNRAYSGFVVYPIAIKDDEACHLLLEETKDRKITLSVSDSIFEDKQQKKYTWTILYAPILGDSSPIEQTTFVMPNPPPGDDYYKTLRDAPPPDPPSDEYWEMFSRYLWEQVTYDSLP